MATYIERLEALVADDPDAPMVTFGDVVVGRSELLARARARDLAAELVALGVDVDDMVTIADPNSVEFVVALLACWMVGAVPQPVSSQLPRHELDDKLPARGGFEILPGERHELPSTGAASCCESDHGCIPGLSMGSDESEVGARMRFVPDFENLANG